MTNKTAVTISLSVFLLYFAAAVFFAVSIYTETQTGSHEALKQFTEIRNKTEKTGELSAFMSPAYISAVKSVISSNSRIIAATIHIEESAFFAYPVYQPYIAANESGEPVINATSPLVKIFSANFPLPESGYAVLTAAVYLVEPAAIRQNACIALIIIFCGMMIALFSGIFSASQHVQQVQPSDTTLTFDVEHENPVKPEQVTDNPDEYGGVLGKATIQTSYDNIADDELYAKEIDSLLSDDEPAENTDTARDAPQLDEIVIAGETVRIMDEEPVPTAQKTAGETRKAALDPMGLFSPKTGIGWESYLETRLDAELIRSASSEQNLALVLLEVRQLRHDNPLAKELADALLKYFNYRDLLFEFSDNAYAVIMQDANFDQAMNYAENIYSDIKKIIAGSDRDYPLGIGISTRAQRLITGSRLINEATLALKKSFEEEELPIVAFKVNTEKYRKYLNEELRSGLLREAEQDQDSQA